MNATFANTKGSHRNDIAFGSQFPDLLVFAQFRSSGDSATVYSVSLSRLLNDPFRVRCTGFKVFYNAKGY